MTVRELIEKLQEVAKDRDHLPVYFADRAIEGEVKIESSKFAGGQMILSPRVTVA